MQTYLVTIALGLAVGVIYGLSGVRSPAPPVIALVGLLGILAGEQAVSALKRLVAGDGFTAEWLRTHKAPHRFGHLPSRSGPHGAPAGEETRT